MRNLVYLIFIFAICVSSTAQQIAIVGQAAMANSSEGQIDYQILNISISVNPAQYIGTNVSIIASANGARVTSWKWRVLHRYFHTSGRADTLLHETSSAQNPSFSIDSTGFYDVQLIARNNLDKYVIYESRLFVVMQPRFTEGQADLVIDMSSGSSHFHDFRSTGDHPDYKIYIKGQTTNGYVEFVDLHGTVGHPVRIQKANDNAQVTIQFSGGSAHPLYFSQYGAGQGARYIEVNGFNLNGTPGIKITGPSGSTVTVRVEGKLTDVAFYGVEVSADPLTIDGAAIAIVPTVASDCKKDNWGCNNLHVYRCLIRAGEEPVYLFESNQSSGYIGNNGFNPPNGIGNIICRNTITAAGRDGLQSAAGTEIEDNTVTNYGQQHDAGGQESCIVLNSGFHGTVKRNRCSNGEMFLNVASGEYAFAPMAGQSAPQYIIVEGNTFNSGTYGTGGTDETHAIYIQNNPNSGAGDWNLIFRNNTILTDNKCAEMLLALGGYTSHNFIFANNICIKTGNAGDTQEFNVTGNGKATLQSGTKIVNNLVREVSDNNSDLYLNSSLEITNTLSAAYTGSPTNLAVTLYDFTGFPIPIPILGYFFGAYSNYNKRMITP